MVDLSIIIINWNTRQLLLDCIGSIYSTVHQATYEVFVVDNGSTDGSVEAVANAYPGVTVIANGRNEGFARANNIALQRMHGEFAVLLNSDTLLIEGSLDKMHTFMQTHPEAGMCGPQLLYGDGSLQASTGTFPNIFSDLVSSSLGRMFTLSGTLPSPQTKDGALPVDFIIGACMFVRKSAINTVGMLDEDYFFFYEEIDWCFRMSRAGWNVYHIPHIEIYHFGGQSTRNINLRARVESWRSRYLYFRKSRGLARMNMLGVYALGFTQTLYHFIGHSVLNVLTVFSLKRLRKRWMMFGYVLLWHLRCFPTSMCLTRQ